MPPLLLLLLPSTAATVQTTVVYSDKKIRNQNKVFALPAMSHRMRGSSVRVGRVRFRMLHRQPSDTQCDDKSPEQTIKSQVRRRNVFAGRKRDGLAPKAERADEKSMCTERGMRSLNC